MKDAVNQRREQFARDGFFVFKNIIEPSLVHSLNQFSNAVLDFQEPEHFIKNKTTGSMVLIDWPMAYQNAAMATLIAHPNALAALQQLGFNEPKFGHGRIISKPPHSPPLFWHEDGRFWDDPVSYTTQPIQCFLMYYLTATTPENGCLRVIPGSHLKRHPLHNQISPKHTTALTTYADPNDPGFSHTEDEIDVPLQAGDLVVGYGSLLHASHGNQTDQRRTVLTMWYYPDFNALPARTKATVASLETNNTHNAPNHTTNALMESLKIAYNGDAEPIATQLIPGEELQ